MFRGIWRILSSHKQFRSDFGGINLAGLESCVLNNQALDWKSRIGVRLAICFSVVIISLAKVGAPETRPTE